MSRLVDADELIKNIKSYTGVFNNEGYYTRNDLIVKAINKTPIAYDVEAVVRELEEELDYHVKHQLKLEHKGDELEANRHRQQAIAYDTAIAIVKRGGRNE